MDIPFVLDVYAYAMYIVPYISKAQKGTSELLHTACPEAKKEVKFSNVFLCIIYIESLVFTLLTKTFLIIPDTSSVDKSKQPLSTACLPFPFFLFFYFNISIST